MLDALDADAVRRWSRTAVLLFDAHRAEIDALNVFPVPDNDTGSNLLLTLRAADDALAADESADAASALAALAGGAARGAIGNSGFIVSQILRGLADAAVGAAVCDAGVVRNGLLRGADLARAAVMRPVDGTILTVARAAADQPAGASLARVVTAALAAADTALQHTPEQLPELADAGVVDAGGRGLVVLLDALARTVTGTAPRAASGGSGAFGQPAVRRPDPARETGSVEFGFEVQYLLDASDAAVATLRSALDQLGDSVAVIGTGPGHWNVHVHVNDVGAAIEAGVAAGRPYDIAVVRFSDQMTAEQTGAPHPAEAAPHPAAVVAVAPGAGLAHLFEAEGVLVVQKGTGTGSGPSAEEVMVAIRASGAAELVLLSNTSQLSGVAETAAERARGQGVRVSVVPTRSPVQGLAAIAVHDPTRRFDDDVVAMAEAAAATRYADVAVASAEALTAVGICQPGDVLGLIDGEVVEIGRGLVAVAFGIIDRLLAVGAELITVLEGALAPPGTGALIAAHVRARSPFTDVTVYLAGQPDRLLIIGVE